MTPYFLFFGGLPRPPSLRFWRYFCFSLFHRHILAPPPPFQVIWRRFSLTLFLSLTDRSPFFPFFIEFLVGFVASPFRDAGVDFEEPRLRLMFLFVESGFHDFPIFLHRLV